MHRILRHCTHPACNEERKAFVATTLLTLWASDLYFPNRAQRLVATREAKDSSPKKLQVLDLSRYHRLQQSPACAMYSSKTQPACSGACSARVIDTVPVNIMIIMHVIKMPRTMTGMLAMLAHPTSVSCSWRSWLSLVPPCCANLGKQLAPSEHPHALIYCSAVRKGHLSQPSVTLS